MACVSKLLAVARKTLKEFLRNRRNLFLTLGLPMLFVLLFGFAFGGSATEETYRVALLDQDSGATWDAYHLGARSPNGTQEVPQATAGVRAAAESSFGANASFGANVTSVLGNLTYKDGKALVQIVRVASEQEGLDKVRSRDVAALVVVPANFSQSVAASFVQAQGARFGLVLLAPDPAPQAQVRIVGDPSYASFTVASGVVQGVVSSYVEKLAPQPGAKVGTTSESVLSSKLEPFDFIVPGLMVYSVLNVAPQCAALLTKEIEEKTLDRIRITRVRSWELLGGVALAQMAIATLEVVLMLAAARFMGFHSVGSLGEGFVLVLLTAVSVVGVGLVIASFAGKTQEAANYGILFSVPAGFLSGSFFPVPSVPLFTVAGHVVQPYDVLPPTHANRALRDILIYGKGLGDVVPEVVALVVLSALFFALGAWLYARRRLSATRS